MMAVLLFLLSLRMTTTLKGCCALSLGMTTTLKTSSSKYSIQKRADNQPFHI